MLVDLFLGKRAQRAGKRIETIDQDARLHLQTYHWPGNVRELEDTIEQAVVLATETTLKTTDPVATQRRRSQVVVLGRTAVGEPAPERRVGRAGGDSADAGSVGWR